MSPGPRTTSSVEQGDALYERVEQVGAILQRPAARLQELDRRPLALLFVEGAYETVTIRDRDSGQVHDVTVEVTSGNAADPGELRRLDRELASRRAPALSPELRDLLLRHPELAQVRVWVTEGGQAERQLATTSARDAAQLAEEAAVVRVDLAEEPIILDSD